MNEHTALSVYGRKIDSLKCVWYSLQYFMEFRLFNVAKEFYPTPSRRVENPVETKLKPGDVVRALVGPAIGKIGLVVIERNGNYGDSELYCDEESIGVGFAEQGDLAPELAGIVEQLTKGSAITNVVRWFDSPDQLEVLEEVSSK